MTGAVGPAGNGCAIFIFLKYVLMLYCFTYCALRDRKSVV